MKRVNCKIILGDFVFTYVTSVTGSSDWDEFTDIATITLPQKLSFQGKPVINGDESLFKRGDKVEIWLGYKPNLEKEFEGFISDVLPGAPMTIKCEDFMWKLKQANITKSYKTVNLETLLSDLLVGEYSIPFQALDVNLGKFRITKANIVQVFEELKKKYGLVTFIQNGTLYSGFPYVQELQDTQKFRIDGVGSNIVNSNNLIFRREDDIKLKVQATSIDRNNKKISVDVGDPDGEQRTFNFFNLTQADLKATAERELEKLKFDGYRGDMQAFGEPFVQHNDIVELESLKTPERGGNYLVKRIEYSLTVGEGYKRKIIPDKKVG